MASSYSINLSRHNSMVKVLLGIELILLVTTLSCIHCQVYQLQGQPESGYFLTVNLGTPPQRFQVLVDSGSSNFAVAAKSFEYIQNYPHFNKANSKTFRDINREVGVKYIDGSWSGRVGEDFFSFASDVSSNASKSVKVYVSLMESVSKGFFETTGGWVGILGMGYAVLAKPDSGITPVMDSLVSEGVTPDKFGLQLCQPLSTPDGELVNQGGRMSLGSASLLLPSDRVDEFKYVAITEMSFYKVILTSIKVGGTSLNVPCTVFNQEFSIVDSGTTELVFNNQTFSALIKSLKSSNDAINNMHIPDSFWYGTSALGWKRGSSDEFKSFKSLEISLQVPNTQEKELSIIIPPQLYLKEVSKSSVNLEKGDYCATTNCTWYKLGIKNTSLSSASGSILGMMLFKGYTVEFDRGSGRIGFAPSMCKVTGLENPSEELKVVIREREKVENCEYKSPTHTLTPVQIAICLIVGSIVLAMFLLIGVGGCCLVKRRCFATKPVPFTSNTADLESMLLRTSSSDSEEPFGSDDDLVIK